MKSVTLNYILLTGMICIVFSHLTIAQKNGFKIEDLSGFTGNWSGPAFGGIAEEQWSGISGNAMMGMFRMIIGSKPSVYEFLLIEQHGNDVVLKFKHIKLGWISQEDTALEFKLVKKNDNKFIFESEEHNEPKRIIYDLGAENQITVTVENETGGSVSSFDMVMKKAD